MQQKISQFLLVLDFADGSEMIVPVDGAVAFHSPRGYKAVDDSISKSFLCDHGASRVRLFVQAVSSLIPEAAPGEFDLLTESETSQATGLLRSMGARILDSRDEAGTVRTLETILRAVPEWRGWPEIDYQELRQQI